jgi:hypothetical protein
VKEVGKKLIAQNKKRATIIQSKMFLNAAWFLLALKLNHYALVALR